MNARRIIGVVVFAAVFVPNAPASDLLVPGQYATIQAAIDAANTGDNVIVAPGTYTGPGNRDIDFKGKTLTVRSVDPQDADVVAGSIVDCQGLGRGFILVAGETADATIDGLTIINADGGAVYSGFSSGVTVRHCVISQCTNGAVRTVAQSTLIVEDCRIVGNSGAQFVAGGINTAYDVTARIFRTLIGDNTDGGMNMNGADFVMADCVVRGNMNVRTWRPVAGGLEFDQGFNAATISRCRFEDNHSAVRGGAMHLYSVTVPFVIENCVFTGNTAAQAGGAISTFASYDGSFRFQNCTIAGNSAPQAAALYASAVQGQNRTTLNSCIVWGNYGGAQLEGLQTVEFSDVQGGFAGVGNIDADPRFVDAPVGDYHLTAGSPCVEAGDPAFVPPPGQSDIDGGERRNGARVDQGADEFRLSPGDLNCDGTTDFFDIDPFLLALFDGAAYEATYPGCSVHHADVNADGAIDFFDIDPFIGCLFGACP